MTSLGTPPVDPVERLGNEARRLFGDVSSTARRGLRRRVARGRAWVDASTARLHGWNERMAAARRYVLAPADAWIRQDAPAVSAAAAVGPRYLIAGLLLAAAYTRATGGTIGEALAPAFVEIVWALGRLGAIALLVPARELPRPRLAAAYLAGLLPYVFGVTTWLRVVVLVASALLTFRGLTGAGLGGRRARTAVLWAFGGQVGVVAFGWVARAALAGLFA